MLSAQSRFICFKSFCLSYWGFRSQMINHSRFCRESGKTRWRHNKRNALQGKECQTSIPQHIVYMSMPSAPVALGPSHPVARCFRRQFGRCLKYWTNDPQRQKDPTPKPSSQEVYQHELRQRRQVLSKESLSATKHRVAIGKRAKKRPRTPRR